MVIGMSATDRLRSYARAEDLPPEWWRPGAGDPRRTRAWAAANRWPGDGVQFLAATEPAPAAEPAPATAGPTFAAVRRLSGHAGWSRMNAVDVCAGTGRDVGADPVLLALARAEAAEQLNLALAGYASPVWTDTGTDLPDLVEGICARAAAERARPAALHVGAESPLLPVLRGLGWVVGVTDLHAVLTDIGTDLDGFLAARKSRQRVNIRRDFRRLADAGGRAELLPGAAIDPHHDEIAALEARSDDRHGTPGDPVRLRAMNERLVAAFGDDLVAGLVRDASDDIVASCTIVRTAGRVLPRFVGFAEAVARPLAGYFHAAYYLPLAYAWQSGATEVLLGPGSLAPKLLRGAVLRPVYSAVPPPSAALAGLLRHTDRVLRDRAAGAGHPVPEELP
jgi:hypothetical protein